MRGNLTWPPARKSRAGVRMPKLSILGITLLAALPAAPARAEPISLIQPIDCTLGAGCYIQHYVDHDPGPGLRDFGCGSATYEAHDGTDFALPTRASMRAGVAVLAAAPGRVRALRDGEADGAYTAGQSVAGKECGNGVVIDHAGGWQTQYCHLREGSIAVHKGQEVDAGETLGLVGISGLAEFPHLHLAVRANGADVDPFRPEATDTCATASPEGELWAEPLPYVGGGLLQIGLAGAPPDYAAVKDGLPPVAELPATSGALVLWAYGFDARAGDVLALSITGPEGFAFTNETTLDKPKALFYRYGGKRAPATGLLPGTYRAEAVLRRAGQEIGRQSTEITVAGQ